MADVIPFAPRRRFARTAVAAADAGPAQILFFTGVRYERQPEPPAAKPQRRPRSSDGGTREARRRRPG
ncbi:hypothetical protein [Bosea sp. (in: a-proteobacteria)]|uniref:hypothetical protein n=1 Tax=Bosea sp. (in: a-proteobacteria) TaxID=1871050 RepID=UPI002FC623E2